MTRDKVLEAFNTIANDVTLFMWSVGDEIENPFILFDVGISENNRIIFEAEETCINIDDVKKIKYRTFRVDEEDYAGECDEIYIKFYLSNDNYVSVLYDSPFSSPSYETHMKDMTRFYSGDAARRIVFNTDFSLVESNS